MRPFKLSDEFYLEVGKLTVAWATNDEWPTIRDLGNREIGRRVAASYSPITAFETPDEGLLERTFSSIQTSSAPHGPGHCANGIAEHNAPMSVFSRGKEQ